MATKTLAPIGQQLRSLWRFGFARGTHRSELDGGLLPIDSDQGRLVNGAEVQDGHVVRRAVLPDHVFRVAVNVAVIGTDEVAVVVPGVG